MGTGQAATMCPFGALWGLRTPVQLMEVGAAEIVAHPRDMLTFMDGWPS